jgi:hypothetical protein
MHALGGAIMTAFWLGAAAVPAWSLLRQRPRRPAAGSIAEGRYRYYRDLFVATGEPEYLRLALDHVEPPR